MLISTFIETLWKRDFKFGVRCTLLAPFIFLLGKSKAAFPLVEDDTLFSDVEGTLDWLNYKPEAEHWDVVGRAMLKSEFKLPKNALKQSHFLERGLL